MQQHGQKDPVPVYRILTSVRKYKEKDINFLLTKTLAS